MATAGFRIRFGCSLARARSACLAAALLVSVAPVLGAPVVAAAPIGVEIAAAVGGGVDVSGTVGGGRIARLAQRRLATLGFSLPVSDLGVWQDAHGALVASRGTRLVGNPDTGLVPVAAPPTRAGKASRIAAVDDQPIGWSLVFTQCYERISDTWAWLDHCARIFRLSGDGDPARDYYGLQRLATAGANAPWVVKSAGIVATPVDAGLMTWVDWSPRGDRTGPCQPFVVWITAPFAGLMTPLDRCETWDITKGARGGDFRLDWSGCACTHERALAFDEVVSVAQGRSPAWYVPAEVHGFPF